MKKSIQWTLIMIVIFMSFGTYAQVSDSIYYNRLYYVCKVWGHVKYYHTETANGNVNWDDELLAALSGIKNAPDNNSFNDSLRLMLNNAGEMGISTGNLPNIPDSLNLNSDYSWIQDPIFSDSVRAILDTIRVRFRPQTNVYVSQSWSGGPPTFNVDNLYVYGSYYPTEEKRILAIFRYWNIINYFFPYKFIMDQNWDTTLVEFIPQIIESYDELSYNLAFRKFTTRIDDSHAFFSSSIYNLWIGYHYTPFLARFIENEMVITKVLPQVTEVQAGDIIKEIDGVNIYHLRDSLREYAHGSNDEFINKELNGMILKDLHGYFPITVDNGVTTHSDSLYRSSSYYPLLTMQTGPIWKDTAINGNCNFGIVDMGRLVPDDVEIMFNDLWDTDAIIFDIRNYPNGTLWYIVDYLYNSSINIANFTTPDITFPGRLYWHNEHIGTGTTEPYSGNIIILFDERTLSQAEYTCMGLEQFDGAFKIGSTTAAADGNVSSIQLPGSITTMATFLGTYYPDYTPTQRVGIIPDFEVHPTIEGIRNGQDEVLDFALSCDFVDIMETKSPSMIKLYPNPVTDYLTFMYEGSVAAGMYKLTNYSGEVIIAGSLRKEGSNTIDLHNLTPGLYLLTVTDTKTTYSAKVIKK